MIIVCDDKIDSFAAPNITIIVAITDKKINKELVSNE